MERFPKCEKKEGFRILQGTLKLSSPSKHTSSSLPPDFVGTHRAEGHPSSFLEIDYKASS